MRKQRVSLGNSLGKTRRQGVSGAYFVVSGCAPPDNVASAFSPTKDWGSTQKSQNDYLHFWKDFAGKQGPWNFGSSCPSCISHCGLKKHKKLAQNFCEEKGRVFASAEWFPQKTSTAISQIVLTLFLCVHFVMLSKDLIFVLFFLFGFCVSTVKICEGKDGINRATETFRQGTPLNLKIWMYTRTFHAMNSFMRWRKISLQSGSSIHLRNQHQPKAKNSGCLLFLNRPHIELHWPWAPHHK